MTDAGVDAGESDAGPPPETFEIRLANNLPGLVDGSGEAAGLHVCRYISFMGASVGGGTLLTGTLGPVPFRGVSPRLSALVSEYLVAMYTPENLGTPAACPDDPVAMGAPTAAIVAVVPQDMLPADSQITLLVTGVGPDTLGASGGALPSLCNDAGAAPTFGALCTAEAQLLIIEDDQTAPAAGMARFRVSNQVVNSTPPSGFTVCYDPGLVPMPDGSCVDTTPMAVATDQVALATAVTYGTVTDYEDRAPIAPTDMPAAGSGGGIYLHLEDTMGCPDFTAAVAAGGSSACYPMLAAAPPTPMGEDPLPGNVRFELEADTINTIFISGIVYRPDQAATVDPMGDFGPSFFVWQDDFVAAP